MTLSQMGLMVLQETKGMFTTIVNMALTWSVQSKDYVKQFKQSTLAYCWFMLGVSALHYSTGSQSLEGVWTTASAHALCQPTITCMGISIVSVQKFRS